jgi:hypothetical protein
MMVALDPDALARLPLGCIHREYPNHIAHEMASEADVLPPHRLTPAFYGAFDWHSAVHAHWSLARIARLYPTCASAAAARAALARSFTPENIAGEVAYLGRADRVCFERPYGLAWLLTLALELHEWADPEAARWSEVLRPLTEIAAKRLADWLPKLTHPVRTGEHSQTAFSLGLAIDWARGVGETEHAALYAGRVLAFHGDDRDAPMHREPSGHDFLSPSLAEADVMRRVLEPPAFARWLDAFLPRLPEGGLVPAVTRDRSDGKLAHLDGLNLSRAWMLEGIAAGLPADDPRRPALLGVAGEHARAGLEALASDDYAVSHWLGSYAVYLATKRGLGG